MRNYSTIFLAFCGMMIFSSCGETKKENGTTMPMQNDSRRGAEEHAAYNLDDGEETAKAKFEDENAAGLYEHYLKIKSALVNADAMGAKAAAEDLVVALEEMQVNDKALIAAERIAQTEEINLQRTAFLELSAAVGEIFDQALVSGNIFKQYCPMAFEGEGGFWFSNSKEIRNPYYGEMMLKCGSVMDTLK